MNKGKDDLAEELREWMELVNSAAWPRFVEATLGHYGATASLNKALKKIEDGQHEDARVIAAASRVIEAALQLPIERIRTLEHALEVRKF